MPAFLIIMLLFGLAMPVMAVGVSIATNKLKHRQKLEEMRLNATLSGADDARITQQNSRIEVLEDRMQVLERIVTDRGLNVAAQIEALRDVGSIDELTRERSKAR